MIKVIKEVKESQTEVKQFPKLMINEEKEIVYFVRHGYGLPLNGVGWDYDNLTAEFKFMSDFKDYNEAIIIQNTNE